MANETIQIYNVGRGAFGFNWLRDIVTEEDYSVRGNGTRVDPLVFVACFVDESIRVVARLAMQRQQTEYGSFHGHVYRIEPNPGGVDFGVESISDNGGETKEQIAGVISDAITQLDSK